MDCSGSIGRNRFPYIINFLKGFISAILVKGKGLINIGICSFSNTVGYSHPTTRDEKEILKVKEISYTNNRCETYLFSYM